MRGRDLWIKKRTKISFPPSYLHACHNSFLLQKMMNCKRLFLRLDAKKTGERGGGVGLDTSLYCSKAELGQKSKERTFKTFLTHYVFMMTA